MNEFQSYFKLSLQHILDWSYIDHFTFLWVLIIIFQLEQWRKWLYFKNFILVVI